MCVKNKEMLDKFMVDMIKYSGIDKMLLELEKRGEEVDDVR